MHNYRHLLLFPALFFQLILAGCNVAPSKPQETKPVTPEQQLQQLYQQAKQSSSPDSERYRLRAVNLLLELKRIDEAKSIYTEIDANRLSGPDLAHFALSGAQLANMAFSGQRALDLLDQYAATISSAGKQETLRAAQLKAQAYETLSAPISGAKQLIAIAPQLSNSAAVANRASLWQLLMGATQQQLETGLQRHEATEIQGWLQLALLVKRHQEDLDRQAAALQRWQQEWPDHPAAVELPEELKLLKRIINERPKKITLLLPLSGRNAVAGRAIRDGFLAAYYHARSRNGATPVISIFDTAGDTPIKDLYQQALTTGTEMIIGPLLKEHVETLMHQPALTTPTLALNYGPDQATVENLYQFGLAVEDEAKQVAERAWQDGHRYAVALLPDTDWGRRVAAAFHQEWQALAGTLLEVQYFSEEKSFSEAIQQLLNIDNSTRRARQIKRLTITPVIFQPRRRQDIDFIFMAASPQQARQIKPTLAFHFAGKVPVYATSQIYSGQMAPLSDRDLDQVVFSEIPWMLDSNNNNQLKRKVHQAWPVAAQQLGRLFALGIDAFHLFPRLQQLSLIRNAKMDGMTGVLQLDSHGRVIRSLSWAQFVSGKIHPLD